MDEWSARQAAHDRETVARCHRDMVALCAEYGVTDGREILIGWAFNQAAFAMRLTANPTSGRTIGEVALYALRKRLEGEL